MTDFSIDTIKSIALLSILEQVTIQDFLDRVYSVTGLPMICFDTSFRHIAHAFKMPFYIQSWVEIATDQKAKDDDVFRYNYLSFQENVAAASKSIYVVPKRNSEHPCVSRAIIYQGELLAYCGTVVEDCAPELVLELNDLVSKTIPHLQIPNRLNRNTLSPFIVRDNLLPDEAERINNFLPSPYFFAILSTQIRGVSTMQYIRSYISEHIDNSVSAITDNGDVYVLFFDLATDAEMMDIQKMLDQLGKRYSFQIAFSCSFFDAAEIPMRRRQALLSMTTGRHFYPDSHMYFLRFLYPEILAYYGADVMDTDDFLTPELKRLRRAAAEKAQDYYLDLFYYLFYSEDYKTAAQKRGVHKNTMIYRISQIIELSDMDLASNRNTTRQLLSLYYWLLHNNLLPEEIHEQTASNE